MVLIGDDGKNAWLGLVFKPLVVEIHSDGMNWNIPACAVSVYMHEQGYEFVGQGVMTTIYKNCPRICAHKRICGQR